MEQKEQKRRKPIRSRVRMMVTIISVLSLLLAGFGSVFVLLRITVTSEEALRGSTMQNVANLAVSKSELADAELNLYRDTIDKLADYIHDLYVHPSRYIPREVLPPSKANAGVFVLQRGFVSEDVGLEDVRGEMELMSNVEQVFQPVLLTSRQQVATIYLGTESGFMLSYDASSDVGGNEEGSEIYYNYLESDWYPQAFASDGPVFTDVYPDSYGQGLMISCGAPFYDAKGNKAGVVCMDIHISDLYEEVVRLSREESAESGAAEGEVFAFLVDQKGSIISPDAASLTLGETPDMDAAVERKILSRESGVALSSSGTYFAFAPVQIVPWTLGIHIPQTVITAPITQIEETINRFVGFYLLGFAMLIIAVLIAGRRFSQTLTEPLISLSSDVRKISDGNLDYRATVHTNDEIGDLAVEFNDMAASLKDHIENLTRVTAEKERIGAELNVATQIQADMLPRIFPPFPDRVEFDIYATMNPAKEVGGDFYDFFLLDDDHIALVMADVSGKGVPAALFMVIAKTLIKNRAMMGDSPAEVLMHVNEQLCEGGDSKLFVTVWLAIVQISTGKGVAANAGHEHPAIRRKGGDYELMIYRHGPPVATVDGIRYREHEFQLNPGDELFVYTDGVPEATDTQNRLFGTERMLQALNNHRDELPEDQLGAVHRAVDRFVGEAPQFDDLTMLSFHYKGKGDAEI